MATDNKAVTAYLPDDIEKSLTQYCISKGLTRKDKDGNDKPSLGTAIVEILSDYFQVTSLEQSDLSQKLEECFADRVKDLVHDLVLNELSQQQKNQDIQVQEKVPDLVQHSIEPLLGLETNTIQEILLDGKTLAVRLSVSTSEISTKKSDPKLSRSDFLKWLKDQDPDKIAWDYKDKKSGKGVHYFPITEYLTDELRSELLRLMREHP